MRFVARPLAPLEDSAPDRQPNSALLRFLVRNQCPHCLGWSAGARRMAEQAAGRRAHIRACVCTGRVAPAGQEHFDFGGAA
jgi:hypothetical protein